MTKFAFPYRHKGQRRAALLAALTLLTLITSSCASRHTPALTDAGQTYHPLRIADGVQSGPGALAWSPDGKTVAFLDGKVNLYHVDSRERKTALIAAPHFLCWSDDGRLLVLSREGNRDVLVSLDRRGEQIGKTALDDGVEAIYSAANTGEILVLTKKITSFPYGTGFTLRVYSLDPNGLAKQELYTFSKTYPWKQFDLQRLLAWTHAGLNPVDDSLLLLEFAKPPAFPPLSRAVAIDPVNGDTAEIFNNRQRAVFTSASWSPDGRGVALTDGDGMLRIRTERGEWITPAQTTTGFYPSWNSKADLVYSGGSVFDLDRKKSETLLTKSAWSIAQWSPDGTKLAVASGGELWLFSGFSPLSPRRDEGDGSLSKKMSLLQKLFREGLITPEEYKERRSKLMDVKNTAPQ